MCHAKNETNARSVSTADSWQMALLDQILTSLSSRKSDM